MDWTPNHGRALKDYRTRPGLGWRQHELATAVGVDTSWLSLLENAQRTPSEGTLQRLLSQMGVSRAEFEERVAAYPPPITEGERGAAA